MDRKIQRLVETIEANPGQDLSLEIMARITHLSASHLRHKFKLLIGVTPTTYVQRIRMRLAQELLSNDEVSVKEVRAAVGFESDAYFTNLCKRFYGVTPSHLKNDVVSLAIKERMKYESN